MTTDDNGNRLETIRARHSRVTNAEEVIALTKGAFKQATNLARDALDRLERQEPSSDDDPNATVREIRRLASRIDLLAEDRENALAVRTTALDRAKQSLHASIWSEQLEMFDGTVEESDDPPPLWYDPASETVTATQPGEAESDKREEEAKAPKRPRRKRKLREAHDDTPEPSA